MTEGLKVFTSLTSGALAGAIAKTAIAPLDRTKIYFQVSCPNPHFVFKKGQSRLVNLQVHPDRNYRIKGAVKFLVMTYQKDGFTSLWRGNSATMLRIMPNSAISYMANEQYKRLLGIATPLGAERPKLNHFLAGSLAGMTSQGLTYPLDRGRAVMAVTPMGRYRNLWSVINSIVRLEGLGGLYRGFAPTMAGAPIYYGFAFYTYEYLKHYCKEHNKRVYPDEDSRPSKKQKATCGAVAGLLGQSSSYPLDIVRRRMQTARQMNVPPEEYKTILGTLKMVLKKEGLRKGWYKGLSMNFIKGPMASSISFMCFDTFQEELRRLLIQYKRGRENGEG